MKKVILTGCNGHMSRLVAEVISKRDDMEVVAGYDQCKAETDFPSFDNIDEFKKYIEEKYYSKYGSGIDCIIDFSRPECTMTVLDSIAIYFMTPMVIATTGFNEDQKKRIRAATEGFSRAISIFWSANMSYEIKTLCDILKMVAPKLEGYDIEILEKHHNRKADAPSGTALMLADAINSVCDNKYTVVVNRLGKRNKNEIGVTALRGGNIVGYHEVNFIGESGQLVFSDNIQDRKVFAEGAVKAAAFLIEENNKKISDIVSGGKPKHRIYNMDDM